MLSLDFSVFFSGVSVSEIVTVFFWLWILGGKAKTRRIYSHSNGRLDRSTNTDRLKWLC